ncbi:FAD-dependent oxidoreductase, partial [Streptomyces sp. NPDC004393]
MSADSDVEVLRRQGRIVVVGASLAGLRAAETLRDQGFTGSLTMIGDEPYEPYDRPPLSKQALLGRARPEDTVLPRRRDIDADWRLGVAAEGLDRDAKQVRLANGDTVPYDRLLITTGTRARPWIHPEEAALDGVFVLRTRDDSARLQRKLTGGVPLWVSSTGGGGLGVVEGAVAEHREEHVGS